MATMLYFFTIDTQEFTHSAPAQVVRAGDKEIELTENAYATSVKPDCWDITKPVPEKQALVFDKEKNKWKLVEDHRQYLDETGTKVGGTPYWLPEDDASQPERYMEELGPLPKGALLERPEPAPEDAAQSRRREIERRLREIDNERIRPLAELTLGENEAAVKFATAKLKRLEAEAEELRLELATLPEPPAVEVEE